MKKLKSCSEIDREMKDREIVFLRKLQGGIVVAMTGGVRHASLKIMRAAEISNTDLASLLEGHGWAWKEMEEVEKKKEIAGVDFVYGLDIGKAPDGVLCYGCCLLEKSGDDWGCKLGYEACKAGGDNVYLLTKIPRKRPHVKGMAATGAWIEKRGLAVHYAGSPYIWSDEHGHYNMKNIFAYAGKEIPGDDFIPEEFAGLIEYK